MAENNKYILHGTWRVGDWEIKNDNGKWIILRDDVPDSQPYYWLFDDKGHLTKAAQSFRQYLLPYHWNPDQKLLVIERSQGVDGANSGEDSYHVERVNKRYLRLYPLENGGMEPEEHARRFTLQQYREDTLRKNLNKLRFKIRLLLDREYQAGIKEIKARHKPGRS